MRSRAVLILTALLLTSTGLVSVVKAGPKGGAGGGGPAPHAAAPAPRAAAPAPQPRAAAPAPRMAAPRVAAPHSPGPGPRMAVPHAAAPRIAAPAARQPFSASSRGSAACSPPSRNPSRRHSGRRVDAHRCWPERDARCAHACKTECGSDCVQHSSLGGTSRKARRCTCTRAGRRIHGNQPTEGQTAGKPITGPGRVGPIGQAPLPRGATEIEMQIGR